MLLPGDLWLVGQHHAQDEDERFSSTSTYKEFFIVLLMIMIFILTWIMCTEDEFAEFSAKTFFNEIHLSGHVSKMLDVDYVKTSKLLKEKTRKSENSSKNDNNNNNNNNNNNTNNKNK
uniref:Uncharacterized protein n=1 Tax=Glossina pallidipes TaxID=7398 RepID=A0A1A9ZQ69_GLOPL